MRKGGVAKLQCVRNVKERFFELFSCWFLTCGKYIKKIDGNGYVFWLLELYWVLLNLLEILSN